MKEDEGQGPRLSEKTKNTILSHVTASFRTITIIVGPTGCGKSTLVPSAVQEGMGGTILCTQPRRLAVVAVATRVAQMKKCRLGQAVGCKLVCIHCQNPFTNYIDETRPCRTEQLDTSKGNQDHFCDCWDSLGRYLGERDLGPRTLRMYSH